MLLLSLCSGVEVECIVLRGVNVLLTLLWTWVSLKIKNMFKYNALQSCNATNSDLSINIPSHVMLPSANRNLAVLSSPVFLPSVYSTLLNKPCFMAVNKWNESKVNLIYIVPEVMLWHVTYRAGPGHTVYYNLSINNLQWQHFKHLVTVVKKNNRWNER